MNKIKFTSLLLLFLLKNTFTGYAQESITLKWHIDFTEASELALKEKKTILLFFHGSDWCPPCKLMQKEVFQNAAFISFAKEKLIFVDVDFPINKKLSEKQLAHNFDLKKRFGLPKEFSEGYPQVVIIDAYGKILYQEKGYAGEGYQKLMTKITAITNTK